MQCGVRSTLITLQAETGLTPQILSKMEEQFGALLTHGGSKNHKNPALTYNREDIAIA